MILREDRAKLIDKYDEESREYDASFSGDEFIDSNWNRAMGQINNEKDFYTSVLPEGFNIE